MQLTTQDLHSLQFDPSSIPSPKFRNTYSFKLPIDDSVVYVFFVGWYIDITDEELYPRRAQLLPGEKILLATTDRFGNLTVYLEHLTAIEGALARGSRGKRLNRDKIGEFVLAFDESMHMLSVIATEKVRSTGILLEESDKNTTSFYYISSSMMILEVSRPAAVRSTWLNGTPKGPPLVMRVLSAVAKNYCSLIHSHREESTLWLQCSSGQTCAYKYLGHLIYISQACDTRSHPNSNGSLLDSRWFLLNHDSRPWI